MGVFKFLKGLLCGSRKPQIDEEIGRPPQTYEYQRPSPQTVERPRQTRQTSQQQQQQQRPLKQQSHPYQTQPPSREKLHRQQPQQAQYPAAKTTPQQPTKYHAQQQQYPPSQIPRPPPAQKLPRAQSPPQQVRITPAPSPPEPQLIVRITQSQPVPQQVQISSRPPQPTQIPRSQSGHTRTSSRSRSQSQSQSPPTKNIQPVTRPQSPPQPSQNAASLSSPQQYQQSYKAQTPKSQSLIPRLHSPPPQEQFEPQRSQLGYPPSERLDSPPPSTYPPSRPLSPPTTGPPSRATSPHRTTPSPGPVIVREHRPREVSPPPSRISPSPQPFIKDNQIVSPKPLQKRIDDNATNQQNEHYKSLRAQAHQEGDAMARCFRESQEAFKSGSKARAKELSVEGKRHQAEMDRLNSEASDWIFRENNLDSAPDEVDLHGLYVKEAIEKTEQALLKAHKRGDTQVRIITGKGLHSPQQAAKLKPAIESLMVKHRLAAELDPNNAGVLVVSLDAKPNRNSMTADDLAGRLENGRDDCVIM